MSRRSVRPSPSRGDAAPSAESIRRRGGGASAAETRRDTASPRERSRPWLDGPVAPAVLAALAVAVFLRSAAGAFVYDDTRFIVHNPHVLHPESWLDFFTDARTIDPTSPWGIVRPLRTMEFAFDRLLFGDDATAFHLHSLAWHVLAVVVLFLVLKRLAGDARVAFAGAAIWAVHPVQVESVAWISSRGDVACGALTLCAVLFALRSKGFDLALLASLAAAALALLYKETAVALPIAIALLRWTRFSRVPLWPYAAVAVAYLVYRQAVKIGDTGHGAGFVLGGGTAGTFATMIRAFGFYVAESLVPSSSLDWYLTPSKGLAEIGVAASLAVHALLVGSAIAARRRCPLWTLAVGWFYVFLLPVANWPFFLGIPTTERFLYLPLAGLAIAVCCALRAAPRAAWGAALAAAAVLGVASVDRCRQWASDDEALWTSVLASHESPRAHAFFGEARRTRALTLWARASSASTEPAREEALAEVGTLLHDSLAHLHTALGLWYAFEGAPRSKAYFATRCEYDASNVAFLLRRNGEALFHAEASIAGGGPAVPQPHYHRALALLELGFAPQAMDSMRNALRLGMPTPDAEIGAFFARAAAACEESGLLATAAAGWLSAVQTLAPGPLRAEVEARFRSVQDRVPRDASAARERELLAKLDARLARLPRSCPARHAAP